MFWWRYKHLTHTTFNKVAILFCHKNISTATKTLGLPQKRPTDVMNKPTMTQVDKERCLPAYNKNFGHCIQLAKLLCLKQTLHWLPNSLAPTSQY